MKIIIILIVSLMCFSSSEGVSLSFENHPPISYHLEATMQLAVRKKIDTQNNSDIRMRSFVDFEIHSATSNDLTLTIQRVSYEDRYNFNDNKIKMNFDSLKPVKGDSEILNVALLQLIGKELHFIRNESGQMSEVTGLLERLTPSLGYGTGLLVKNGFKIFLKQLFQLAQQELEVAGQYPLMIENVFDSTFDGQYTVTGIDDKSLQASCKGIARITATELEEIKLTGHMKWNLENPLLQQGSLNVDMVGKKR